MLANNSSSCRYFFTLKKQQDGMIKMQSCLIFLRISPLISHPHGAAFYLYNKYGMICSLNRLHFASAAASTVAGS